MLGSGSAHVARFAPQLGFDSLLLDMEHGPLTTGSLSTDVPAAGACPFVRVPSARGIDCPEVGSADEAALVVEACRHRLRDVLAIVQIESVRGFEHLEETVSVPGLDGVFPGPSDPSVSFGGPPGPHSAQACWSASRSMTLPRQASRPTWAPAGSASATS